MSLDHGRQDRQGQSKDFCKFLSHYCTQAVMFNYNIHLLSLQLKKESKSSKIQWTAGCTTNCSGKTTCRGTTPPPCYLECCNTTLTSCLWLNGTLNVLSSAERIFNLNIEYMASLLCALAIFLVI